jgi:hypothetical protein
MSSVGLEAGVHCRLLAEGHTSDGAVSMRRFYRSRDGADTASTDARHGVDYVVDRIVYAWRDERMIVVLRAPDGEEATIAVSDRLCAGNGLHDIVVTAFELRRGE